MTGIQLTDYDVDIKVQRDAAGLIASGLVLGDILAQNQALIIDKAALDGGSPAELRGKLREYKSVSYRYISL